MGLSVQEIGQTIVALASARGAGERNVIRLSGDDSLRIAASVCRVELEDPVSRNRIFPFDRAVSRKISLQNQQFPVAMRFSGQLLMWPDSRSYTGQPAAEIHFRASIPFADSMVEACCAEGARIARSGEFTMRAFLAGRMDLTQAEAVLGVIHAGDEKQFEIALRQLAGGLAGPFAELREELLLVLADLEAGLDFVEEDIEFIGQQDLVDRLEAALKKLQRIGGQLRSRSRGEKLFRIALVGSPNAGKSSLFNRMCHGRKAIVSGQAGTTRDYLIARLQLGTVECELVDTAGIDLSDTESVQAIDGLDQAGRNVSREIIDETDLLLWCFEARNGPPAGVRRWLEEDAGRRLIVATKGDQAADVESPKSVFPDGTILTSAIAGNGIEELKALLIEKIGDCKQNEVRAVPATILRCGESLRIAETELERAVESVRCQKGDEVTAFCLRIALDAIGEVSGTVYTDDVLDRVFSRFCIGK